MSSTNQLQASVQLGEAGTAPMEWRERLRWQLLCGVPPDQAVPTAVDRGAGEDAARDEAQAVVSNPLYGIARTHIARLMNREWLLNVYASLAALGVGPSAVDTREPMPREEFIRDYYGMNRAVVFPGLADHWSAKARWSNPDYLIGAAGDITVEIMANRASARVSQQNTSPTLRERVKWSEYVARVFSGHRSNDYYMVSRNRFFEQAETQELLDDIDCPEYVRIDPAGEHVKLWFGPAGTITPFHHDDRNNLIVQVVGRKTIRLYAPYFAEAMEQTIPWYAGADPEVRGHSSARLRTEPVETAFVLEAGDALFIPVGWWHALEALEPSMTLAFTDFGLPNKYPLTWERRGI